MEANARFNGSFTVVENEDGDQLFILPGDRTADRELLRAVAALLDRTYARGERNGRQAMAAALRKLLGEGR